jgi:predicted DNA-binding protein (UPF0251 family)
MARPEKKRDVHEPPRYSRFKPVGVRGSDIEQVMLTLDEYEAIRLADFDGLEHSEAAERMGISRPTFTRLVAKARHKIAIFIIEGRSLVIEGGAVHFSQNLLRCFDCGATYSAAFAGNEAAECPECGSDKCEDLAAFFGHGRCCRKHGGGNNG